ncbi:MAG: UDP-N-acetylmuramoyl-L-alanine--D-glutamate ligase [Actinomycetia bacterium]|nr:UDP-N-acetylmuramoyl-L-alanine--D-glutamate ligase [Actinomycetes bacterium]
MTDARSAAGRGLPARALVVGLARSGEAAALALVRRGVEVLGTDRDEGLDTGRLRAAGVEVRVGASAGLALLRGVEVVVKSPGIPASSPLVAAAHDRRIDVWSEVELGFRILDRPIVGVTGTNGKTTTTELLGAIFRAAGRSVAVAGNVGTPLCSLDGSLADDAWIACELSSFQLEDIVTFQPRAGVLLNLAPDHLDRHGSLESYTAAKLRLFENQAADDVAIVPRGFGQTPGTGRRVEFSADDALPAEPAMVGLHNRENAAAAAAAAASAGIGAQAVAHALTRFRGVAHRLEPIGEVRGVLFVNDSKATNPAAAECALRAYPGARVIMGGSRKGTPFGGFAEVARETGVAHAYLIGESAAEIARALSAVGVPHSLDGSLESAVRGAFAKSAAGASVVLAPACASYDQFRDFEQRGECFREIVQGL